MNPMQLIQMLQSSGNPQMMMQNMFGNNPMFQRAMQMGQGKSPEQMQQTVINLAKQRGMSNEDLSKFLSGFGLKI